ncbi:Uncharacterised protein [Mycobacteroides abscessus subsp. abscessus]|nr:Uncharacterised protein [Mycobacteroides abscessus subsp. abscessus]
MINFEPAEVAELDRQFTELNELLEHLVGLMREQLQIQSPEMACLWTIEWMISRVNDGTFGLDAVSGACAAALVRLARQS